MRKIALRIDGKSFPLKRLAEHLVESEVCHDFKVDDFLKGVKEEIKKAWAKYDDGEGYPRREF